MPATALAALALAMALVAPAPVAGGDPPVVVVVHPARGEALAMEDLAPIFLRRRRFWADGTPIVPLNLAAGTPVRDRFTARVLAMDPGRLTAYWNERYFQGVFPPAVVSSSAAMKRYVATDPGAIGYLELHEVDDSVRVVLTIAD
jgi:hypothetical protein